MMTRRTPPFNNHVSDCSVQCANGTKIEPPNNCNCLLVILPKGHSSSDKRLCTLWSAKLNRTRNAYSSTSALYDRAVLFTNLLTSYSVRAVSRENLSPPHASYPSGD